MLVQHRRLREPRVPSRESLENVEGVYGGLVWAGRGLPGVKGEPGGCEVTSIDLPVSRHLATHSTLGAWLAPELVDILKNDSPIHFQTKISITVIKYIRYFLWAHFLSLSPSSSHPHLYFPFSFIVHRTILFPPPRFKENVNKYWKRKKKWEFNKGINNWTEDCSLQLREFLFYQ